MALCHFCNKIKEIREKQGREYYQDLCASCQSKEAMLRANKEKTRVLVLK